MTITKIRKGDFPAAQRRLIKVLKVQEFVWQYQVVMYRHWAFAERNWNIYEESIIVIIFFIVK